MNLSNLIQWSLGVVLGMAAIHHLDDFHKGIIKAQAKLIYESRTSSWGSSNFLKGTNAKAINERKGGISRNQNN